MIWPTVANIPPFVGEAFVLLLNPMRGHTEDLREVACSDSREELEILLAAETVAGYDDPGINDFSGRPTTWGKYFRKGGPLEWFNPVAHSDRSGIRRIRREGWVIV